MALLQKLRSLARNLIRRDRIERDLDAEVRSFSDLLEEEKLSAGMSANEAKRSARIDIVGPEQLKEEVRGARSGAWLETIFRDIRFGARMLRKNPGFTSVAILTLALGIGANTAIFSIVESQLWRPLPFPDSERLVDAHPVLVNNPKQWDVLSVRSYRVWRDLSHSFMTLAAYIYPGARNLTANGASERVLVMPVTFNFFDTFKVPVAGGRAFSLEEETPGRERVAIVSDSLWRDRFGADPAILGKPITLDGEPYVIVGIGSPRLHIEYLDEPAVFVPLLMDPSAPLVRNIYVVGRLASDITPERARVELAAILNRQLKSEGVQSEDAVAVTNLRQTWTQFAARSLYFFAGAVSLVLLIACFNTAGLLLARGLARRREFSLRAALGATRFTLIRQLLVESLMLAFGGGVAGTFLGLWLAQSFAAFIPADTLPLRATVALDTRVLFFTVAVSVFSALLLGVAPAIFASRTDLNDVLRQSLRGLVTGRSQHSVRRILVASEVALGLVLLFGAGLFLSSFVRLQQAPRGFDAPGALTFQVSLRGANYSAPDQMLRYFNRLSEKLNALPGVRELTLGSGLPLAGSTAGFASVNIAGRPPIQPHGVGLIVHAVSSNYFDALHIQLVEGRTFNPRDNSAGSPRVAIMNRNAAHELFGTEDPVGKILEFVPDERRGVPAESPVQIIGLSENAQEFGANEVPMSDLYVPFAQHPVASAYAVVSSRLPRAELADAIRTATFALDKDQPIYDLKTMDERIENSTTGARFNLFLVAGLAVVGVLLVSVGIFGTVSYFVQQRTQEFGVRLALGATPGRILRQVIVQSLATGFAGLSGGIAASLFLGRLLRHALYLAPHEHTGMLYGVSIYDPVSLSIASLLLVIVVTAASYIPARRAMKVDPMVALRHE
jgi:putative ABC transport system permease protein